MKIIMPNATILDDATATPYQMIEKIGRTCYKSEDLITDTSAVKFVGAMLKNRHFAMLEHYHLIFNCRQLPTDIMKPIYEYTNINKYLNITHTTGEYIISGSFRAFIELFENIAKIDDPDLNIFGELFEYKCSIVYPGVFGTMKVTESIEELSQILYLYTREKFIDYISELPNKDELAFRHLTHTVLFTCDRGVTHEFVRHRPASFAQESTRYCNYSKGKFGGELTFLKQNKMQ